MADKDEKMPVSSDQNTNPKMSLSTNNADYGHYFDESIHKGYNELIVEKYIPDTKPQSGEKEKKK